MIALLLAAGLLAGDPEPGTNLCADPRNCREVGQVAIQVGTQTLAADINETIPFVSEDGLSLFVGESVVVIVGDEGELTVESHGPAAEIITEDKLMQAAAEMNAAMAASGLDVAPSTIDPIASGRPQNRVRLSMMQLPGSEETVLLVENGYGRRFDYQAFMQVPGRRGPEYTTTCELVPDFMVLEHWPHAIAVITVTELTEVTPSREIVCD